VTLFSRSQSFYHHKTPPLLHTTKTPTPFSPRSSSLFPEKSVCVLCLSNFGGVLPHLVSSDWLGTRRREPSTLQNSPSPVFRSSCSCPPPLPPFFRPIYAPATFGAATTASQAGLLPCPPLCREDFLVTGSHSAMRYPPAHEFRGSLMLLTTVPSSSRTVLLWCRFPFVENSPIKSWGNPSRAMFFLKG